MSKSLFDYLPPFYQKMVDLKVVMITEQTEIEILKEYVRQVNNNFFVSICDEPTLAQHEELLGIIVSPGDTIDYRRQRVISEYNSFVPYTIETLKEKLNSILGKENYVISWDDTYSMHITIKQSSGTSINTIKLIQSMLITMLPAHLGYRVTYIFTTWGQVKNTYLTWRQLKNTGKTWKNVKEGT